jgi:hypothetical protein
MAAFGSQPQDFGDAGVPTPPPPEDQFGQLVDDIHKIEQKYVEGHTNFRQVLQLAANGVQRIDMQGQRVNAISLTAKTGDLGVYLFDCSGNVGQTAFLADFEVSASVAPNTNQWMIPERDDYVITVQEANNAAATGVIRLMKL